MTFTPREPPARKSGRPRKKAEPPPLSQEAEQARKIRKWGVVATFPLHQERKARAMSTGIRGGRYKSCRPAGAYNSTSAIEDGVVNVYMKYTGKDAGAGSGGPVPEAGD